MSDLVAHVQELLAAEFGPVRARRMFGAWGLYREAQMFALVADDCWYLKTDTESRPLFAARGLTPFVYHRRGRATELSYWRAPEEALEDPAEAARWARLALAAALRHRAAQRPQGSQHRHDCLSAGGAD